MVSTFRVSTLGRVGSVLIAGAWVALALATSLGKAAAGVVPTMWVTCVVGGLAVWRWAFVPFVAVGPDGVTIQNAITSSHTPYESIASVSAGYDGVTVVTKDHRVHTAWAVQKSNLISWTNGHTRADDVVAAIRRHCP